MLLPYYDLNILVCSGRCRHLDETLGFAVRFDENSTRRSAQIVSIPGVGVTARKSTPWTVAIRMGRTEIDVHLGAFPWLLDRP